MRTKKKIKTQQGKWARNKKLEHSKGRVHKNKLRHSKVSTHEKKNYPKAQQGKCAWKKIKAQQGTEVSREKKIRAQQGRLLSEKQDNTTSDTREKKN